MAQKRKPLNIPKACSICGEPFSAENCWNSYTILYGNNAEPVNEGKCCDACNRDVVIPARIMAIQAQQQAESGSN